MFRIGCSDLEHLVGQIQGGSHGGIPVVHSGIVVHQIFILYVIRCIPGNPAILQMHGFCHSFPVAAIHGIPGVAVCEKAERNQVVIVIPTATMIYGLDDHILREICDVRIFAVEGNARLAAVLKRCTPCDTTPHIPLPQPDCKVEA